MCLDAQTQCKTEVGPCRGTLRAHGMDFEALEDAEASSEANALASPAFFRGMVFGRPWVSNLSETSVWICGTILRVRGAS